MKEYSTFIFEKYTFDQTSGKIELVYSLDDEEVFTEVIMLPRMDFQHVPVDLVERAIFALHLIGGMSYFKTCCPKTIEVRSGELSEGQADFWNEVYTKGLGEFFFQNQIDPTGLISFPALRKGKLVEIERPETIDMTLVPIGGGKDSLVTAELLKKAEIDISFFRVGEHPLINEMTAHSKVPTITLERALSPNLFALNADGALNGHVPITAYISCLSVVTALLYGYTAIAFSNERSASHGNTEHKGLDVNHQWSKGIEFESAFREYIRKYITKDLEYFSLLRHLSELSIAREMSTHEDYLPLLTSCNKNWKISSERQEERWCRDCAKCAFSYALFAAFLPREKVTAMFGGDLFSDPDMRILYRELFNLEGIKPFDCVGEPDEVKAAFLLAHERGDFEDSIMMQMFVQEVLPTIADPEGLKDSVLTPSKEHYIPLRFLQALHAHS